MNPTLADWLEADATTRSVFMDWLLERIPPGYRDQRESDHSEAVFPRFVHEQTGVLFHVIFGGPAVMGMTPARWERVLNAIRREVDEDEFASPVLPDEAREALSPPCEVLIETALVAERPLVFGQLRKLGLDESVAGIRGVEPRHLGALLAKLPRLGWRVPSEAEWEYVLRVSAGDEIAYGASGALLTTAWEPRLEFHVAQHELCRDDFASTLADYPEHDSRGDGHTTVRGQGPSVFWRSRFNEVACPGRYSLDSVRGFVSLRPWVSLRHR